MLKLSLYLTLSLIVLQGLAQKPPLTPCGNEHKKAEPRACLNCYDQVMYDEEINTYVLAKDGFTLFTGKCQSWNRAGYLLEELTCKNGKRDGIDTSYYSSGCVQSVQSYIIGIKNGKQQVFYDTTGQLRKEENYLNGKLHGSLQEYNRSGDTIMFMNFKNDLREGKQREYYPNGKPLRVLTYTDGLLDGPHLTFSEEGKPEISLNYQEGKKDGKCIFYHGNSKEARIENWSMDTKNGDFITLNEAGQILSKGTFKKDIPIGEHLVNDEKGKLIHQTLFDKKGVKQYEMEIDEYGDKKVLFDIKNANKPQGIQEDDNPEDIQPKDENKNKRKKRRERRKKDKT